jgi:SAM-dependent methyltransferase
MPDGEVLPIPCKEPARQLKSRLATHPSQFYQFAFTNGVTTAGADDVTQSVHDTRARLILPWLDRLVGTQWNKMRCLDVACNEGWFSIQLALRGASSVLGVDLRNEHIEVATTINGAAGLPDLSFQQGDLFNLRPDDVGTFDVTLFLGVLYHLDNPVDALRLVRSLTNGICVIETQVARAAANLESLWGSGPARSGPGIAVVPSDDHHVGAGHDVALVPSLAALSDILYGVGFRHVSLVVASRDEFVQFVDADRVVVFALT